MPLRGWRQLGAPRSGQAGLPEPLRGFCKPKAANLGPLSGNNGNMGRYRLGLKQRE
jgi:hypothetical protein